MCQSASNRPLATQFHLPTAYPLPGTTARAIAKRRVYDIIDLVDMVMILSVVGAIVSIPVGANAEGGGSTIRRCRFIVVAPLRRASFGCGVGKARGWDAVDGRE